jgi:hypothetical protein
MTTALACVGAAAVALVAVGLGWCWVVNRQLTTAERRTQ